MIKSEKRCSANRCYLSILLVLGLMILLLIGIAGVAEAKGSLHWLKEVRDGQFKDHCSIVFIFRKDFSFTPPVVQESEALITFGDTGTALPPFRKLRSFHSSLQIEKKADNVEVRITIPKDFPRITYARAKGPTRLIIRFNREEGATLSSPAANPPPQGSPETQDAIGNAQIRVTPDNITSRAPSPLAKAVAMASSPHATDIGAPSAQIGGIAQAPPPPEASQRRSYNYLDLDIRQALSALAQDQEVNVIMSPEVIGKISVHLNQVTLEEAIRSIGMAGGFTYRREGESFYVYKPKLIADPQEGRLQIRVFQLKFAAIDKVQEILSAIPGMRMIRLHEPSKTVIVEDTPENIAKIENVLLSLDLAPRQVLIEARLMEVTLGDDMSLGVDWRKVFGDLTIATTGFAVPGIGLSGNLITSAIGSTGQFTAAIQALQTKTQVNTLSTPKILAIHGKPARVQVGGRQGYKTNTFTPTGTTENISFLDTGTILDITPYIDSAGNVLLDVKPQINSVTITAGIPNQQTTTVSTSMLAKSGQTMFIGGLIRDTKTETRNAVPCFGSIPGLGLLFGSLSDVIGKSELIILITPEIIDLEKPNAEGQEKTRLMEEKLKKEPQSLPGRLLQKFP